MEKEIKSRYGYYYDLDESPYTVTVQGDDYIFPSKKKYDIFLKNIKKELKTYTYYITDLNHIDVLEMLIARRLYNKMKIKF